MLSENKVFYLSSRASGGAECGQATWSLSAPTNSAPKELTKHNDLRLVVTPPSRAPLLERRSCRRLAEILETELQTVRLPPLTRSLRQPEQDEAPRETKFTVLLHEYFAKPSALV